MQLTHQGGRGLRELLVQELARIQRLGQGQGSILVVADIVVLHSRVL